MMKSSKSVTILHKDLVMESNHISVLLNEAIEALSIKEDGIYVDCTLGGGGHSSEILKRIIKGHLYAFDQDPYAVMRGNQKLQEIGTHYTIIQDNFVNIKKDLNDYEVNSVDGVLYDLGVSSFQFDIPDRGFSYNFDAVLDMRMNTNQTLTAKDIVNGYSYEDLKRIFYLYGEEPFSKEIARSIVRSRETKPIETTFELVEVIKKALPAKQLRKKGHPARQVFQALRIEVNNELDVFRKSLEDSLSLLNKHGRCVVISFNSLEDRICKQIFKDKISSNLPSDLPIKDSEVVREFRLINTKVITPTEDEVMSNNRSHSAKLRIIEKII